MQEAARRRRADIEAAAVARYVAGTFPAYLGDKRVSLRCLLANGMFGTVLPHPHLDKMPPAIRADAVAENKAMNDQACLRYAAWHLWRKYRLEGGKCPTPATVAAQAASLHVDAEGKIHQAVRPGEGKGPAPSGR